MALNKNSNAYTILYTVVMVVIVGALLATVATVLKPKQDENILNEQKANILKAFGDKSDVKEFGKLVKVGLIKNGNEFHEVKGDEMSKVFELLSNRKALAAATDELPIFEYEKDGDIMYVLPLVGKGLWGDIWGYIALKYDEGKWVVAGITMDHAGETPGLGAEIATEKWQEKFVGKAVYDENLGIALKMQKGLSEAAAKNDPSKVDAITGGTKTCDGVNLMLETSIKKYNAFFNPGIK